MCTITGNLLDNAIRAAKDIENASIEFVMRQHEKGWVKIFDQGALMFDDIDLFTMLQLVARVVADSLGNFLKELPGSGTPTQP